MAGSPGIYSPDRDNKKLPLQRTQWLESLSVIRARFALLAKRLSQMEELADASTLECDDLLSEFESSAGSWLKAGAGGVLRSRSRRGRKSGKPVVDTLKQMASEGVWLLEFAALFDGYARIHINNGKPFTLAPALAELLSAFVSGRGKGRDEFNPWKTIEEVQSILGKKAGYKIGRHSVNQRIFRLRDSFEDNGINPYFIQTNRTHREVRLALNRDAVVTFTSEPSVAGYETAIRA